jgi:glycosyltransferase involved in cell wall biosynthesis
MKLIGAKDIPEISVVIPAYNASATLAETIISVQKQTFTNFEIIVVDDGSTDQTGTIAKELSAHEPRLRLIHRGNDGVAAARNAGLKAARAPYIAPLDADDVWHVDKLMRQMRRFAEVGPDTVLVYSWSVDIDGASIITDLRLDLDRFEGDVYSALVLMNFIGNASVPLIRRDALVRIGGWDPSLLARNAQGCEDWQTYLRLAEIGDFALAPGFLIGYRQSATAMSRQVEAMTRSYRLVMDEARARHRELPSALFRWSQAAFEFYRFELLYGLGAKTASLLPLAFCISLDPTWLARSSTWRKLKRWMRSQLFRAGLKGHQSLAPPSYPIGIPYFDVPADPSFEQSEGHLANARRKYVAHLPITRKAHGKLSPAPTRLAQS